MPGATITNKQVAAEVTRRTSQPGVSAPSRLCVENHPYDIRTERTVVPLSPLPRAAETKSLAAHGASLGQGEGQTGSSRYILQRRPFPEKIGNFRNPIPDRQSTRQFQIGARRFSPLDLGASLVLGVWNLDLHSLLWFLEFGPWVFQEWDFSGLGLALTARLSSQTRKLFRDQSHSVQHAFQPVVGLPLGLTPRSFS